MSVVHINLEDVDGKINFQSVYSGGFDPNSHAHQHARLIEKVMDKLARAEGDPAVILSDHTIPEILEINDIVGGAVGEAIVSHVGKE